MDDEQTEQQMPARPAPSVRVQDWAGELAVVELGGELDLLAAIALGSAVDQVTGGFWPRVVLDLRTADFIDAGGLGLLVRARRRTHAHGGRMAAVATERSVLRILHASGVARLIPLAGSVPDAVARLTADRTADPTADR
ncbi:STAS domain-containing protein [Streptacidiphilus cavernicola]|uniref:Anti-sigma factor antagonist n=1 Tax=Streptacidiphilus cavernicola TaxID=3342716 RepID=A0ABV6VPT7_9ACTN